MSNKRQWYAIKSKLEKEGRWNYSKRPKKATEKRKHTEIEEQPDSPGEGPSSKIS